MGERVWVSVGVGGESQWGKREARGWHMEAVSSDPLLLFLSSSTHTLSLHMHTQQAPSLSLLSPFSLPSLSRSSSLPPHPSPVLAYPTPLLIPLPGTRSAAQRAGWGCCVIAVPNAQAPLALLPRVAQRRESQAGECEKGKWGRRTPKTGDATRVRVEGERKCKREVERETHAPASDLRPAETTR